MKKILFIYILFIGTICATSCSSRRMAINSLESLVNQVEKNGDSYTMTDWDRFIKKCAKVDKELKRHEFTAEENREIGTLKGRMAGIVTKDVLQQTFKSVNTIKEQLGGGAEGFLEELLK